MVIILCKRPRIGILTILRGLYDVFRLVGVSGDPRLFRRIVRKIGKLILKVKNLVF